VRSWIMLSAVAPPQRAFAMGGQRVE